MASKSLKSEASETDSPEFVTFSYEDKTYSVDREAMTDVLLLELVEDGKYISAIRGYLGTGQWEAFKERHTNKAGRLPASHLEALQGTGNPRLMAAGISMATIPTMASMVACLSGVFVSSKLVS